jgi:hypothetical protein
MSTLVAQPLDLGFPRAPQGTGPGGAFSTDQVYLAE